MSLYCSDYEVLTVTNAVKTLTAAKITPTTGRFANQMADQVLLTLETDAIRYALDTGTTVSATVGTPMAAGTTLTLSDGTFRNFTAYRVTTDAKLHVSYFHRI